MLDFFIIHENLCLRQFFSFRKVWIASVIYHVHLIVVIMYNCTHKAVGSHH